MYKIYKITCNKNGKIYIGQTKRALQMRFDLHVKYAEQGGRLALSRAIMKYGKESFTIEQIDQAESKEEIDEKERYYIKYFNSTDRNIGYNLTDGGEGGNTYKYLSTERLLEIKDKISSKNLGEQNGKHTVIYMKDTILNKEKRFGSFQDCERFLIKNCISFKPRQYAKQARYNRDYGIQHRLDNRYVFRFENDNYGLFTDFPSKSGTFPMKATNRETNEVFIGICRDECLAYFGLLKHKASYKLINKKLIMEKYSK